MEVKINREQPVYEFEGCCPEYGQKIVIYANDIRKAEVGKRWSCEDQDQYPNRERCWDVEVELVYKNTEGALLITTDREPEVCWHEPPNVSATWVQLCGGGAFA